MPTLSGGSRVARKANLPWKILEDVGLVLDLDTGDYYELDEVGLVIWQALDGDRTLAECARAIASSYTVAEDVAERDVQEFVEELLDRRLAVILSV